MTTKPLLAPPTARQAQLLEYMLEYQAEHGAPPSVREMTRWLGASSTNAANDHLILMERKGMVRRYRRRARAWVPISPVNKEST